MNLFKKHSFDYINKGLPLIPDRFMGKTPLIKSWTDYCERLPSKEEIIQWSEAFKESNISLCLGARSKIVALDLDTIDERFLKVILPILPPSPVVKKGAKGETRFFRFMGEVNSKIQFNGECILEVLSTGKKTTLPPSIHPCGEAYKWTGSKTLLEIKPEELPIIPPMLIAHIESVLRTTFRDLVSEGGGTKLTETGRNGKMISLCGKFIAEKKDLISSLKELVEIDKKENVPPLFSDPEEFRQTEPYTNALSLYSNVLKTVNERHYRGNEAYEIPSLLSIQGGLDLGKHKGQGALRKKPNRALPTALGAIKIMQDYVLRNSYKEQPAFALAASLGVMSTILGRRFVFKDTAPNLYMLLLGGSGTGKQAPQECATKLLTEFNKSNLIGGGDYVSDASLMDNLEVQPERLDTLDEASGILKSITSAGGNDYGRKMADILCTLWSCSNSAYLGRTVSAKKSNKCSECKEEMEEESPKRGECYKPNVNLIMATTYTGLEESVTTASLDKGLLGRFMVFRANEEAPLKNTIDSGEPIALPVKNLCDGLRRALIPINRKYLHKGIYYPVLDVPCSADELFNKHMQEFKEMQANLEEGDNIAPIIARLPQQYKKLALCHAAGMVTDPLKMIVTERDLNFAYEMVLYSLEAFQDIVEGYLYRSQKDKEFKIVLREIKKHGSVSLDALVLSLRAHLTRKRIMEIVEELVISTEIERILDETGIGGVRVC